MVVLKMSSSLLQPGGGERPSRRAPGEFHRDGPNCATLPSVLTENPYQRPERGPRVGPTLRDVCAPVGALARLRLERVYLWRGEPANTPVSRDEGHL
jgi:hypothetical protein